MANLPRIEPAFLTIEFEIQGQTVMKSFHDFDTENDPPFAMEKIGLAALLDVVTFLVEAGFIRGSKKGGEFVEVDRG